MDNPQHEFDTNTRDPKVIGMVSYLTLIGWIIALVMNNPKSEFASFHIRQSLGLMLIAAASRIMHIVPFVGGLVVKVVFAVAILLMILVFFIALQGEKKLTPVIGEYFQEWFKTL